MVINSPYYSVYEELASPEQTATGKDVSNPLYGCDGLPKTVRVFQFTLDSSSEKLDWFLLHQGVCFTKVSTSPRVNHVVSFDAAVASSVSAPCIIAAGSIVAAGFMMLLLTLLLLLLNPLASYSFLLMATVPADYVPTGHVLISADRYRIC
ncbi:hypothetical protein Tco_0788265 [Tanacetum coccineum]